MSMTCEFSDSLDSNSIYRRLGNNICYGILCQTTVLDAKMIALQSLLFLLSHPVYLGILESTGCVNNSDYRKGPLTVVMGITVYRCLDL